MNKGRASIDAHALFLSVHMAASKHRDSDPRAKYTPDVVCVAVLVVVFVVVLIFDGVVGTFSHLKPLEVPEHEPVRRSPSLHTMFLHVLQIPGLEPLRYCLTRHTTFGALVVVATVAVVALEVVVASSANSAFA